MRKLLMGSLALLVFSIAVIIFQASCSKEVRANDDHNGGGNNSNSVLYRRVDPNNGATELWSMNTNGNNRHKINIVLPQDYYLEGARIVDNGQKIVFVAVKLNETDNLRTFFKCNLNGSNVTALYTGQQFEEFVLQDVY